ncbi:MAG: transporter, partial [Comamonas sp.]
MATFSIRTLLAASFIALNGAAVAQEMPKITLNVVGNLGITTQSKELEAPMWTQAIPAASGGAITVTFKPWNEMGLKGGEVIKLLRQGLFDVGTTVLGFLAGEAAINDSLDLAGASTSLEMARDAMNAFRPYLNDYYLKNQQVKVLGVMSYGDQVFFCRDKFEGLADLKGRKVRVCGSSQADFVAYFGGSG